MPVRFGIIGLGNIAHRFADALASADDAVLEAVASQTPEKLSAFSEKYAPKKAYGRYEDLLSDKDVDAVYVALPHNFHADAARQSILRGKAVLCEKPFFINTAEAMEILSLAKEKNVLVMEAMWTRCLPEFLKIKEWLAEGRIGKLKYIQASFSFFSPYMPEHRLYNPALAGGGVYDVGVYPIHFALGVTGQRPSSVSAMVSRAPNGVDDFALISLAFADGVTASLTCGISVNLLRDSYIYGTDGCILMRDYLSPRGLELYDRNQQKIDSYEAGYEPRKGFVFEINHFCALWNAGKLDSDLVPHSDTLACTDIAETVLRNF